MREFSTHTHDLLMITSMYVYKYVLVGEYVYVYGSFPHTRTNLLMIFSVHVYT